MASRAVNGCNRHVKGNLYKLIRHTGQVAGRLYLNFVQLREEFFRFLITVVDPAGGVERNMKSMQPPSAAIFFNTYFTGRGGMAPWPPPGSATASMYSECPFVSVCLSVCSSRDTEKSWIHPNDTCYF